MARPGWITERAEEAQRLAANNSFTLLEQRIAYESGGWVYGALGPYRFIAERIEERTGRLYHIESVGRAVRKRRAELRATRYHTGQKVPGQLHPSAHGQVRVEINFKAMGGRDPLPKNRRHQERVAVREFNRRRVAGEYNVRGAPPEPVVVTRSAMQAQEPAPKRSRGSKSDDYRAEFEAMVAPIFERFEAEDLAHDQEQHAKARQARAPPKR